jgi:hypothetical protein
MQEEVSWLSARHHAESVWESGACFRSVDSAIIPSEVERLSYV